MRDYEPRAHWFLTGLTAIMTGVAFLSAAATFTTQVFWWFVGIAFLLSAVTAYYAAILALPVDPRNLKPVAV
jgi:hypothetical protein